MKMSNKDKAIITLVLVFILMNVDICASLTERYPMRNAETYILYGGALIYLMYLYDSVALVEALTKMSDKDKATITLVLVIIIVAIDIFASLGEIFSRKSDETYLLFGGALVYLMYLYGKVPLIDDFIKLSDKEKAIVTLVFTFVFVSLDLIGTFIEIFPMRSGETYLLYGVIILYLIYLCIWFR